MKHTRYSLILLVTFLVFTTIVSSTLAKEELPDIVKRISPSVVVIYIYDNQGKILSQGSGFFINKKGDVITNYHVLEGGERGAIKTAKGKIYSISSILAEDREGDLIRISAEIPQSAVSPLSISTSPADVGERIAVIGNPLGLEQTVSDGIVSAVREIPSFGRIIQISAPISSGSSGSPVVNMKGEVIGVATFQMIEGQNLNFAIPSERVTSLIEGKKYSFTEWTTGREEKLVGSAEDLYSTGLSFLWSGEYNKALPYFEEAVKKNPNYAEAYFFIGYCKHELHLYKDAIEAYKKSIKINPNEANAYYNLGLIYQNLKQYKESIEFFKQSILIDPNNAEGYYFQGFAYCKLELFGEAVKSYKQAIRIKPDYANAYSSMGHAYHALKNNKKAIESYKLAISIDPTMPGTLLLLVYGHEQGQELIKSYKQAIQMNPDDYIAYCNLGSTYYILQKYNDARDSFVQAIRINPDFAFAHYQLGSVSNALKNYNGAIKSYKQAISLGLDPDNSLAYCWLGGVYTSVGRYRDAIDAYKQAIHIYPDNPLSYYELGYVYLLLGDRNSALKQYKILKTIDKVLADLLFDSIYEE